MGLFNFLGKKPDLVSLYSEGAICIDVRTTQEFGSGHAKGWKSIPLPELQAQVEQLRAKGKPILLCCASGMRSGIAARQLRKAGLEAYNAGAWQKWN